MAVRELQYSHKHLKRRLIHHFHLDLPKPQSNDKNDQGLKVTRVSPLQHGQIWQKVKVLDAKLVKSKAEPASEEEEVEGKGLLLRAVLVVGQVGDAEAEVDEEVAGLVVSEEQEEPMVKIGLQEVR